MRKLVLAAATAAALSATASPALAAPDRPPLDPVHIDGGSQGCQPDYPCDIQPITVSVDKTYPSRLGTWAKEQLPRV
jgi:hypothetical protein